MASNPTISYRAVSFLIGLVLSGCFELTSSSRATDAGSDSVSVGTDTDSYTDSDSVIADSDTGVDTGPETDTDMDTDTNASARSLTATLKIPVDFTGITTSLQVAFFQNLPPTGPPDGMGDTISTPVIIAGEDYVLTSETGGVEGEYFVYVVIFIEGGGTATPVTGVDYVGSSSSAKTLGGPGMVDFGDIEMTLRE